MSSNKIPFGTHGDYNSKASGKGAASKGAAFLGPIDCGSKAGYKGGDGAAFLGPVGHPIIVYLILGGLLALGGLTSATKQREQKIQSSYVQPSKLEIKLQDLDGNGENETLLKYDGRTYLLRLDDQDKPIISGYKGFMVK